MDCEKLPSKIESKMFNGNIDAYNEALYKLFKRDFIDNTTYFNQKPVDIIHQDYYNGKERTYWHIVSEGDEDANRTPISTRAEKIAWIKFLILEDGSCPNYKFWTRYHDKTKKTRLYIMCDAVNYLVVLENRGTYYKLITAFPVQEYSIKKYLKYYKQYLLEKTKTPTNKVDEISTPPTQG